MRVLVFDVETNGIPLWGQPSDDPRQPRVCELSAELFEDTTGDTLATLHAIIQPDGWEIPPEMADIHGISHELAQVAGVPMKVVLPMFLAMWARCDIRCAHNQPFDMRLIRIEMFRNGYSEVEADAWKTGPAFCTQARSQKIVDAPPSEKMVAAGRRHSKTPNLAETYEYFTGKKLDKAHTAAADVAACKAIYMALLNTPEPA